VIAQKGTTTSREGRTFRAPTSPTSDTESDVSRYEDAPNRTPESSTNEDPLSYSTHLFEPRTDNPFTSFLSNLLDFNHIPINVTMVNEGTSGPMNIDSKNGTKELRINYPTEFDGNRDNLENFLQDCQLYLAINEEVYNTDTKKIIFVLSFLKKGTALTWKESWAQEKLATTTQDLGTFTAFKDELKKAFSAADTEGDARAKLRQL
jgi:hypothetical protein